MKFQMVFHQTDRETARCIKELSHEQISRSVCIAPGVNFTFEEEVTLFNPNRPKEKFISKLLIEFDRS